MGSSWVTLGSSWVLWGHPGSPWGHPGSPWGHSGSPWGRSGSPWGHPGSPWGRPGSPRGHPGSPGVTQGLPRCPPGVTWGRPDHPGSYSRYPRGIRVSEREIERVGANICRSQEVSQEVRKLVSENCRYRGPPEEDLKKDHVGDHEPPPRVPIQWWGGAPPAHSKFKE